MKPFNTFGEYMFELLFAPLKRGKQAVNQFFIFCRVAGREFDDLKETLIRVRDEANIATASEVMLPIHGQDRDMPRLAGEDAESYRARLMAKGSIAELGGLKEGVLYALAALGYEASTIEPYSYQDPSRWAEFIVFLKGSQQSGVNDLSVIDAEVRKVKEGGSKPAYGAETGNRIVFLSAPQVGRSSYPMCGCVVCGVWPEPTNTGRLIKGGVTFVGGSDSGIVDIPEVGTVLTSELCYTREDFATLTSLASVTCITGDIQDGGAEYARASQSLRCSEGTFTPEGGEQYDANPDE